MSMVEEGEEWEVEEEEEEYDDCFQAQALPVEDSWTDEELRVLIESGEPPR
jgi:hypothetical protein